MPIGESRILRWPTENLSESDITIRFCIRIRTKLDAAGRLGHHVSRGGYSQMRLEAEHATIGAVAIPCPLVVQALEPRSQRRALRQYPHSALRELGWRLAPRADWAWLPESRR